MEKKPLNCKWLEHASKKCPNYDDEALKDFRGTLTVGLHGDVSDVHKKAEAICAKCDVFEQSPG